MDGSSKRPPSAESGAIIDPQFCAPYSMELTFSTKAPGVKRGRLAAVDPNGTVIFKNRTSFWNLNLRTRNVMVDAYGNPLVSMQRKLWSFHKRWKMFKGDRSYSEDLLFSVKNNSIFEIRTNLDVFLASNKEEEVCDYKIKGEYCKRSCTVYKGDTSLVVAQMSKELKVTNSLALGKHAFGVNISPNTDSAFIAALIILLHEQYKEATLGLGV